MKVKVFDENHEKDLENSINEFIIEKDIIDIKFNVSIAISGEEQIYCFSALVMYKWITLLVILFLLIIKIMHFYIIVELFLKIWEKMFCYK